MTPQTLSRRLREEGQGFQALKDDLRRDAAIELLQRPELTLLDIAPARASPRPAPSTAPSRSGPAWHPANTAIANTESAD